MIAEARPNLASYGPSIGPSSPEVIQAIPPGFGKLLNWVRYVSFSGIFRGVQLAEARGFSWLRQVTERISLLLDVPEKGGVQIPEGPLSS